MDMMKVKSWGEAPSELFKEGAQTREDGGSYTDCPYIEMGSPERREWLIGWNYMNEYLRIV